MAPTSRSRNTTKNGLVSISEMRRSQVHIFSDSVEDSTGRPLTAIEKFVDVEEVDTDLYRSRATWTPIAVWPIYGGVVATQAILAAVKTVPEKFVMHSFHSYFILAGDGTKPILYHVERVRDGKSFATRSVAAKQDNKTIFTVILSFQSPTPSPTEHQVPMPLHVPHHSTLLTQNESLQVLLNDPKTPQNVKDLIHVKFEEPKMYDIKDTIPVNNSTIINPPKRKQQMIWLKSTGQLPPTTHHNIDGNPSQQYLHQIALLYMVDYHLLDTVGFTHGVDWFTRRLTTRVPMMASLDYTAWFHGAFRADEWLLFVLETPRSSQTRGLVLGRVYTEDGTMIATVAQEGVVKIVPNDASRL